MYSEKKFVGTLKGTSLRVLFSQSDPLGGFLNFSNLSPEQALKAAIADFSGAVDLICKTDNISNVVLNLTQRLSRWNILADLFLCVGEVNAEMASKPNVIFAQLLRDKLVNKEVNKEHIDLLVKVGLEIHQAFFAVNKEKKIDKNLEISKIQKLSEELYPITDQRETQWLSANSASLNKLNTALSKRTISRNGETTVFQWKDFLAFYLADSTESSLKQQSSSSSSSTDVVVSKPKLEPRCFNLLKVYFDEKKPCSGPQVYLDEKQSCSGQQRDKQKNKSKDGTLKFVVELDKTVNSRFNLYSEASPKPSQEVLRLIWLCLMMYALEESAFSAWASTSDKILCRYEFHCGELHKEMKLARTVFGGNMHELRFIAIANEGSPRKNSASDSDSPSSSSSSSPPPTPVLSAVQSQQKCATALSSMLSQFPAIQTFFPGTSNVPTFGMIFVAPQSSAPNDNSLSSLKYNSPITYKASNGKWWCSFEIQFAIGFSGDRKTIFQTLSDRIKAKQATVRMNEKTPVKWKETIDDEPYRASCEIYIHDTCDANLVKSTFQKLIDALKDPSYLQRDELNSSNGREAKEISSMTLSNGQGTFFPPSSSQATNSSSSSLQLK